jgi:hypothetical protein
MIVISPDIIMSGDFNHVTLDRVLPTLKQYMSCPTREERTLDLMYASLMLEYLSSSLPPLGRSDHNLVHLKTPQCASGEEEAYDHKDCEEVVGGGL